MKTRILIAGIVLTLVSCEKRDSELDSKIDKLEKQAAEAIERQRQLEAELAEQKLIAERDAIERERTLIEQERMAMAELRDAENKENADALAELEKRQMELMERDRKMAEIERELDGRQQELTGLEAKLSERELELAGREPIATLPSIQKTYVSGPTGDYNNFYEPLAAYGSWFQTSDYGYVYQPTIVRDSSWRPYTRGRWAFTDHGWTWVSNEPFGWACYHYGRWALLRNIGWVWIPGNKWAPAWVSWRESPGYVGWAPLPPETLGWSSNSWDSTVDIRFGIDSGWFTFISYSHFGNDIYSHCLPRARNTVIYHSTTTVTHYVIRDRYIYCGGPRYRNVCDRIGRPFPIHRLRLDHCPDFGRGGRRLNSRFDGNELQVVAPQMDAEWNHALHPSRVNRNLGEVVVDRTNDLPEDVRRQYRESRQEEEQKATRWVNDKGGREAFENERKSRLEKNREEVVKNESRHKANREEGLDNNKNVNPTTGAHELTDDQKNKPGDKGSKHRENNDPRTPGPEVPAITDTTTPKTQVDSHEKNQDRKDRPRPNGLPPGIIPNKPGIENHLGEKNPLDRPSGVLNPGIVDQLDVPKNSNKNDSDQQKEADKLAAKELREQQEALREERRKLEDSRQRQDQQAELLRQQELEARKAKQKQEELELTQQQKQEKLDQHLKQSELARKQKEQAEQLREQEEQQKLERKEQQEKLREEQRAQQELARKQQDQLRAQQEQQEKLREQQEMQEKQRAQQAQQDQLRAQQELARKQQDQLRAQQEQQEKLRAQQEMQEKLRAQQEQQERQRAQQEQLRQQQAQQELARKQQEQMERQRAQQEQQERMRQQQEEAQRRAQEQQERAARQQQEQMERQRAQQEQQERARQQQEQMERQRAQQEQQERARQQQEEAQRRMEEQQKQKERSR